MKAEVFIGDKPIKTIPNNTAGYVPFEFNDGEIRVFVNPPHVEHIYANGNTKLWTPIKDNVTFSTSPTIGSYFRSLIDWSATTDELSVTFSDMSINVPESTRKE